MPQPPELPPTAHSEEPSEPEQPLKPEGPRQLNPRDPEALRHVQGVIDRVAGKWTGKNVVALRPAIKVVRGVARPDTLAIAFFVRRKLTRRQLEEMGIEPVPPEVEGIPTDVVPVVGAPRGSVDERHTRSQMFDTLVGGIAVGNAEIGAYGTLGMICFARSDSRAVGLTNEHVLAFNTDGQVGDSVEQPRFYLHKEASIESADCCPNGQIRFRQPENIIADVAAGAFAALAIAAAASDVIDPHRRGQDATPVDPGERTRRETVAMEVRYPTIPFPGQNYKLGVKWRYDRHTDRRVLTTSADEERDNPHVVREQALLTDHDEYVRGQQVHFTAMLGPEVGAKACDNYFVVAACQSPSRKRSYRLVLRPAARAPQGHDPMGAPQCFSFVGAPVRQTFSTRRVVNGLVVDPEGHDATFQEIAPPRPPALRVPRLGVTIRFPRRGQRVSADLLLHAQEPVTLIAYDGANEVGRDSSAPGARAATLTVSGNFDRVHLEGGMNEAQLWRVCLSRRPGPHCLYTGIVRLAPDEELGMWQTYLLAQTRNNVAQGADPLQAARTIGGLVLTDNFITSGQSENITYGKSCNIDVVPSGQFLIMEPSPPQPTH